MQGMTGEVELGKAHGDKVRPAVHPLTSTLFVLIKTRCGENDCREERNTGSDKHRHAHAHTQTHKHGHTPSREEQPSSHNIHWLKHQGRWRMHKQNQWMEIEMTFKKSQKRCVRVFYFFIFYNNYRSSLCSSYMSAAGNLPSKCKDTVSTNPGDLSTIGTVRHVCINANNMRTLTHNKSDVFALKPFKSFCIMTTLRCVFFSCYFAFVCVSPRLNDFHGLYANSNIRRRCYSPRCFCAFSTYVTGARNGEVPSHKTTLFGSAAVVLSSSVVFVFGHTRREVLQKFIRTSVPKKKKESKTWTF